MTNVQFMNYSYKIIHFKIKFYVSQLKNKNSFAHFLLGD